MSKIIFVLTNTEYVKNVARSTGFDVRETAAVWEKITNAGEQVTFTSPRGGPVKGVVKENKNRSVLNFLDSYPDEKVYTQDISSLELSDLELIYFVGGIGTMWDFPYNPAIHKLLGEAMKRQAIIASICHGSAAYLGAKYSDSTSIISGITLTGFSDDEENARNMLDKLPFSLEKRLISEGAIYEKAKEGESHVIVDMPFITAQNPSSAQNMAKIVYSSLIAKEGKQNGYAHQ